MVTSGRWNTGPLTALMLVVEVVGVLTPFVVLLVGVVADDTVELLFAVQLPS